MQSAIGYIESPAFSSCRDAHSGCEHRMDFREDGMLVIDLFYVQAARGRIRPLEEATYNYCDGEIMM